MLVYPAWYFWFYRVDLRFREITYIFKSWGGNCMLDKNKTMLTAAAVTLALSLMLPSAASAATTSSSSTALTPIREASAKYGADVKWNQKTHTITITKDDSVIVLEIGKNGAIVNGKQVAMDHPVTVVSGRALADSKFIDDLFKNSQQSGDPADLFVDALQSGNGAQAAQYVSESFAATLPQNKLNVLWSNFETILGKMKLTGAKTEKTNSVHRNVTYAIQAGTVSAEITIRLNLSGLIDDLNIAPATNDSSYLKPSYDKADSYTEQEVIVGQGDLALPGTLTLPKGEGPFPAVVLVHGSGRKTAMLHLVAPSRFVIWQQGSLRKGLPYYAMIK
ncbi:stalk domain-containing protein [Paenibacillus sp. D2_2]|uniref:stalk domain-containing protein n=1 Tax=Paenibacillus sp. D2_2 TaxID=3073092 RepID=UPI0035BF2F68